jgi:hypothetical protein
MHGGGDPGGRVRRVRRARKFTLVLLACLDEASDLVDGLDEAFQSEDLDGALALNARLQSTWAHAYVAIQILERISHCSENEARRALGESYRRARLLLALAWSLVSRIPVAHLNGGPTVCKARL